MEPVTCYATPLSAIARPAMVRDDSCLGELMMGERYMAGTKNRICRQWLGRLTRGSAASIPFAVVALTPALACSDLAPSEDSFCSTTGEGKPPCIDPPPVGPGSDNDFTCLGLAPQPLPTPGNAPVGFVQPVVDWFTRAPLAGRGLQATLCSTLDPPCAKPLATPYMVQDRMLGMAMLPPGAAGVPMLEGFDGFIKFDVITPPDTPTDNQFVSEAYYLTQPVSGAVSSGPPVLMVTKGLRSSIAQNSFNNLDPNTVATNGIVVSGIYDCKGNPVTNARVEITLNGQPAAGVVPFLLPASRIPNAQPMDQPLYTTANAGIAGFLNVPPGTVKVLAYRADDTTPFGEVQLGSVPGQITVGPVRPAYLNSANLTGYTPLNNDMPTATMMR
jgi:hypothetical protein